MISDIFKYYNQNTEFDNDRVMIEYTLFNMKLNILFCLVLGVYEWVWWFIFINYTTIIF